MQKDLVLGLDLDGTICDYPGGLNAYMLDNKIITESCPPPDTYALVKATGWPFHNDEEYITVHRQAVEHGIYAQLDIYDGVSGTLSELSEMGVHIRIVTHRLFIGGQHARVVSDTVEWLDHNHVEYRSICFTGLKDSIGADLYIEDSPQNINGLRATGHHCMVVDQPYTQDVKGPRLLQWSDSAEFIYEELVKGRAMHLHHGNRHIV
jgi:5'(3')-deoxyribonucleotidase